MTPASSHRHFKPKPTSSLKRAQLLPKLDGMCKDYKSGKVNAISMGLYVRSCVTNGIPVEEFHKREVDAWPFLY